MLRSMMVKNLSLSKNRERAYKVVRKLARAHGFQMLGRHLVWPQTPHFRSASQKAEGVEGLSDARCFVLQSAIRSVESVGGDVAECGVRFARSTLFLMSACERERHFHLFDSFEGLSQPSAEDVVAKGVAHWRQGDLTAHEDVVRENLKEFFGRYTLYKGWIPDRFQEVSERSFAFVHVDVDLFEPTRDALAFFTQRLAPGGVILCDDYGSAHCPGARKACNEAAADFGLSILELPTGQCLMFRQPGAA